MIPYGDKFVVKNNFFFHNSSSFQKIGRQVSRKPRFQGGKGTIEKIFPLLAFLSPLVEYGVTHWRLLRRWQGRPLEIGLGPR